MEEEIKTIDDFPPFMKEYPFVRKGMTVEEYEKEKAYWGEHLQDVWAGTYKPLWKQGKDKRVS